MRHIRVPDSLPDEFVNPLNGERIDLKAWAALADSLLNDLKLAKTKEQRDQILDDGAEHWGKLKPWLLHLSKG